MSTLRVNNVTNVAGTSVPKLSGMTVQTVQTVDATTTSFASGANTFNAHSKLDTNITPKFSGSKFLIRYQLNVGALEGSIRGVLKINGSYFNTITTGTSRSSTNTDYVVNGLPGTANIYALTGEYLYTHTGSGVVAVSFEIYKQAAAVVYVNRAYTYDDYDRGNPTSWCTVQEIAA